jgi:glycosyltransferase involved in cell wall biosynthesis
MNIALCHFRVGEIDGVSLEMEKWKSVLEKEGHHVSYISGSSGTLDDVEIITELHYNSSFNNEIVKNSYVNLSSFKTEKELQKQILQEANAIESKLTTIIHQEQLDIIIVNNIFSLGWNLSAAIGFFETIKKNDIECICHHHDFYWEREKYSKPTCNAVEQILKTYFPPKHSRIKHIVINSIAQNELLIRKSIESKIVPNVFDFDVNWEVDGFNSDFRTRFGIKQNDFILLQATRIVKRKAIELAIDYISELNKNKDKLIGKKLFNNRLFEPNRKIILLMAGLNEEDKYFKQLLNYADYKKVDIKWIGNHIDHVRSKSKLNKKYTLWDAYVHCDMVCYTSILEGWGNQFIEAIVAKKLIVSYQYPVFESDILPLNFTTIDLGNIHELKSDGLVEVSKIRNKKAIEQTIALLLNKNKCKSVVEENFRIGNEKLSMLSLQELLKSIIQDD